MACIFRVNVFVQYAPHINTTDVSHLQSIWLSKVSQPPNLYGEPDVDHLSSNVAQWQVADHYLLSLSGICQTHVAASRERSPR